MTPAAEANDIGCGDLKSPYTAPSVTPATPDWCQCLSAEAVGTMVDLLHLQPVEMAPEVLWRHVAPVVEALKAWRDPELTFQMLHNFILFGCHRAEADLHA